jgi:hypothetical protein
MAIQPSEGFMSHVVGREPWGTVDLDVTKGHVFVRQDWNYHWQFQLLMRPWSEPEKAGFHRSVDRQVWRHWSKKATFMISFRPGRMAPTGDGMLKQCASRGLSVSFDVRRVSGAGHWKVNVLKLGNDQDERANVDFVSRIMTLYYNDTAPSAAVNERGDRATAFMTIPHEFGHTLDADDEYETGSRYLADQRSLLNIGTELRPRHLRLVAATLEKMVPGCIFTPRV